MAELEKSRERKEQDEVAELEDSREREERDEVAELEGSRGSGQGQAKVKRCVS